MRAPVVLAAVVFLTSTAGLLIAAEDPVMKEAQSTFAPIPLTPPPVKGVTATPALVELGKALYFDPRLSQSHNISCNTCHQVGLGGVDMLPTSIGHKWQHGARNSPTVLNSIFNIAQFWDGRAADLAAQAGGPIQNPVEMATTHEHVIEMLKGIPGYEKLFKAAFPSSKDPITMGNVEDAIAAFEATLITPNAPFDKFLRGDENALTSEQREGLQLFMSKGCSTCHFGINVGGQMYAPFGVVEKPGAELLPQNDKGRFDVTKTASDEYVFRVPPLRNVELTPPYFHSGKAWDLRQAVAVMGNSQLGEKLTDSEITKITAFLRSLTGDQPKVTYPILPPSDASTPRPEP
ncbi:cytochrome-c peroxidase [Hyphomicrobium sp. ghe19]|uniref:cytochrome-c peroxidase n=1 Tax=Hyphomicrobium sp. ghe19 TaxID=2682968 RepID=UPI001366A918|nr:Cytochrome c551 peroxidase [Hyphomicrobium sp. ghe19]